MQGFRVRLTMAEAVLSFQGVQHRHKIPAPRWSKPWAHRLGPGIVDLNLKLYPGSILGLVGPNGAGKTTLLRMMAGILPLQTGTVMERIESEHWTEVEDLRTWVGHMPEQVRWQGRTTVRSILLELGEMRGAPARRIDSLLSLVGLQQRQDEQLDNLSQGMRQRLSIAAALLGSPKVLLLDEPFNGLDPVAAQAFTELIQRLANKGVSIVISSHMVAQLGGLIDRIGLIHRGQLLDEGPLQAVETRLALSGRYTVSGPGEVDLDACLKGIDHERIELMTNEEGWHLTFTGESKDVLQRLLSKDVVLSSWSPVAPNLVEWLCAATGMDVQDISLEVASSALLPMRTLEVGEDE